jgi:hypothetical protein
MMAIATAAIEATNVRAAVRWGVAGVYEALAEAGIEPD